MNASGSVPWVLTLHVLDSVYEIGSSVRLALAEVLASAQHVIGYCLMILNSLFNDHCLWEILLESLVVESHGSTVQYLLFTVTEAVLFRIKLPLIVPLLLLSRCEVTMSLLVHFMSRLVLTDEGTTHWIDHFFG